MPKFNANITLMFREQALLGRFEAARSAGFSAVEILTAEDVSYQDLARAGREAGVDVVLCNAPMGDFVDGGLGLSAVPGRQQQFRDAIDQAFEMVSLLDCPRVHIGPSRVSEGGSRESYFDTLVENLIFAADRVGDGVQLLVEPLNSYDTPDIYLYDPDDAMRAIRAAGRPNVALQFDIYHMARMGADIVGLLETHIDHIGHIQFADILGRGEPGSGTVDFATIFAALDRLGYGGWVGAEYNPTGKTEDSLAWFKEWKNK